MVPSLKEFLIVLELVGDAEFCLNGTRFEEIFDCFGKNRADFY